MDQKRHLWKFCQVFGDRNIENVQKADIISAVEFDKTGDYMAAGDNGGRLVLFNIARSSSKSSRNKVEYNFITEFQSHEPDFDHLRSLEIEERINAIKFLPQRSNSHLLLTTNVKTIKLWKVTPTIPVEAKPNNIITDQNGRMLPGVSIGSLKFPALQKLEPTLLSTTRKLYGNAHTYHINSLALCSDMDTFISSDDLRVNIWCLDHSDVCFTLVDIKPDNVDEITQLITCCSTPPSTSYSAPSTSSLFQYSTSKGITRVCDMRMRALCENCALEFADAAILSNSLMPSPASMLMPEQTFMNPQELPYFITDAQFSPDGRRIVTRDFFYLRVWDLANTKVPVHMIPLHENIRPQLTATLEQNAAQMTDATPMDKFSVSFSPDGRFVVTGSYNYRFYVHDIVNGKIDAYIESSRIMPVRKKSKSSILREKDYSSNIVEPLNSQTVDFTKKLSKAVWHPQQNILSLAACSNLYIYAE